MKKPRCPECMGYGQVMYGIEPCPSDSYGYREVWVECEVCDGKGATFKWVAVRYFLWSLWIDFTIRLRNGFSSEEKDIPF